MLTLWRRHTPKCPHRSKGRDYLKCKCPIWTDGELHGQRHRHTLKTRDWQRAARRILELEGERDSTPKPSKPVAEAIISFLSQNDKLQEATLRKHRHVTAFLCEFLRDNGVKNLRDVTIDVLGAYKAHRLATLSILTWSKELQTLRHFFGFCLGREWIDKNFAKGIDMPRNLKPKPVESYSPDEVAAILAACNQIGRATYERLRSRAMILLMRYTGLRISDVATLSRDQINDDELLLATVKTGSQVRMKLHPEVISALEILPAPRGSAADCKYYFWTGHGTKLSAAVAAGRTLSAVYKKSKVRNAHSHRFRHTLATDILVKGGTAEDAANLLGNDPAMIRQHYAKWTPAYQSRTAEIMQRVHGTSVAQTEKQTAIC